MSATSHNVKAKHDRPYFFCTIKIWIIDSLFNCCTEGLWNNDRDDNTTSCTPIHLSPASLLYVPDVMNHGSSGLSRHITSLTHGINTSTLPQSQSPAPTRRHKMLQKLHNKHQKRREANANERKRIQQLNDAIKRLREATNQSSHR